MQRRKLKKMERLNLIPILDSVFIFIFFLLMSAQFIQIHEIGSDAPAVKTTDSIKDDKPPLNLTLVISKNQLTVKTGIPEKTYREISSIAGEHNYLELSKTLLEIKRNNEKEKSIIFRPDSTVNYKSLVKLMDSVRNYQDPKQTKTQLFEQIIFETIL